VTIACFGLAFKPDIDDLRESPALEIAETITQIHPGKTLCVEPNIEKLPAKLAEHLTLVSVQQAVNEASILVLLVDHKIFKDIDPGELIGKKLVDTKGIWIR